MSATLVVATTVVDSSIDVADNVVCTVFDDGMAATK